MQGQKKLTSCKPEEYSEQVDMNWRKTSSPWGCFKYQHSAGHPQVQLGAREGSFFPSNG